MTKQRATSVARARPQINGGAADDGDGDVTITPAAELARCVGTQSSTGFHRPDRRYVRAAGHLEEWGYRGSVSAVRVACKECRP